MSVFKFWCPVQDLAQNRWHRQVAFDDKMAFIVVLRELKFLPAPTTGPHPQNLNTFRTRRNLRCLSRSRSAHAGF